jgi:hypothetical protein
MIPARGRRDHGMGQPSIVTSTGWVAKGGGKRPELAGLTAYGAASSASLVI